MTQLATRYTLNAKIRETPYTELHRGYRNLDGAPVVVKLLRNERPSPLELARLRHEYEILVSFEVPQVVKPLGLERHGQGLALVMEDTGEESLDQLIRLGHLDLQRSLVLAVAMAQTVAVVHAHHIIHKDIKPEHFFLHQAADNPLVLVDFGIATWLSQQAQAASPLSEVEGTLAYVAPEQTGRMNRIVDWRSDLYSLGVTLYELFTGCLPFEANDPLELVHCHIARSPRSPRICRADLPVVLSELILKLLAKTAEERYQSAAGVQHDLERCLEQLKLTGRIEAFQLAEFDSSGELSIPQKLYGREQALAEMLATLERAKQGTNEFLLLTGEAGVGKSALVNELHPHVVPGGYFAPGKFDYLARSVPYGPISHVCHALVQSILAESPADLERRRRAVLDAAGPNG